MKTFQRIFYVVIILVIYSCDSVNQFESDQSSRAYTNKEMKVKFKFEGHNEYEIASVALVPGFTKFPQTQQVIPQSQLETRACCNIQFVTCSPNLIKFNATLDGSLATSYTISYTFTGNLGHTESGTQLAFTSGCSTGVFSITNPTWYTCEKYADRNWICSISLIPNGQGACATNSCNYVCTVF